MKVEVIANKGREENWLSNQTAEDQELLRIAREAGLIDAYVQVLEQVNPNTKISMRDRAFLRFLQHGPETKITEFMRLLLQGQFGHAECSIIQNNGVAAIFADGDLRLFIPAVLLNPPAKAQAGQGKAIKVADVSIALTRMDDIRKTRFGYVPVGNNHFRDVLRKRSIGAFAN